MSTTPVTSPVKAKPTRGMSGGIPPSPSPLSRKQVRSINSSSYAGRSSGTIGSGASSMNNYSQTIAKSMTIEEMRQLHARALNDAEAKRTELRLVLASRYRELVGSSEEVLKMRERSQELHQLVHALPSLMTKLSRVQNQQRNQDENESKTAEEEETQRKLGDTNSILLLRRDLSRLPRMVHRALDKQDVYKAATSLIQLFGLIATHSSEYPLANSLGQKAGISSAPLSLSLDPQVRTQIKMTFLYVQTIPARILRMTKGALHRSAESAEASAAALATLHLLDGPTAVQLLDLYFDSKAKLLQSLLNQLSDQDTAEQVLTNIVGILQHDIILHPYLIFVKRNVDPEIMASIPFFDPDLVQTKASHCLAAHLPLIRTKVKSVLISIAGTTAHALGQIRQTLYDKTDGAECLQRLDADVPGTWEQAVQAMVDVRIVLNQGGSGVVSLTERTGIAKESHRKFSLWSALFSNTFSSLVHSLLTTSFHSVHAKVVSTLRTSLANAPPFSAMLPHEAYRNTLKIATELDASLLNVSEDAHELLVHAEERSESERRLRQSLYVQTCEIMGRLVCELRRMLLHTPGADGTKEFLVGRLCHLLLFRLTSLPTLLNPDHSPAVKSGGMITLFELQSAFDLADDNEDGLITFEEAMEAVDSAFSGTQFHGAEMIRETLLLKEDQTTAAPPNVTLHELALLSARGLRHESSGPNSALGTIKESLNDIIDSCFAEWSKVALQSNSEQFNNSLKAFLGNVISTSESEWQRIYGSVEKSTPDFAEYMAQEEEEQIETQSIQPVVGQVSPHVVGFFLAVSSVLNRSVCPSDSSLPAHVDVPSMVTILRLALLNEALQVISQGYDDQLRIAMEEEDEQGKSKPTLQSGCTTSGIAQLNVDVVFAQLCLFTRNQYGFSWREGESHDDVDKKKSQLDKAFRVVDRLLRMADRRNYSMVVRTMEDRHRHVLEVSDLFFSSLLGGDTSSESALLSEADALVDYAGSSSASLVHNPLSSSRRFGLLPVQADRSLSELQRRGKYGKEKDERASTNEGMTGGVSMSSFFSSMLKKK